MQARHLGRLTQTRGGVGEWGSRPQRCRRCPDGAFFIIVAVAVIVAIAVVIAIVIAPPALIITLVLALVAVAVVRARYLAAAHKVQV